MNRPNPISDQAWAFIFMLSGCIMTIVCHRMGISGEIGSGIVGGGLGALTKAESNSRKTDVTTGNSPVTINQIEPK